MRREAKAAAGNATRREARAALAVAATGVPAAAALLWAALPAGSGLGAGEVLRAAVLAAVAAVLGLALLARTAPNWVPGPADRVTLARAALVALLLALAGSEPGAALAGAAAAIAALALLLDGLDGWVARRTGSASGAGARFDMETDAALMLVLALLAWRWDRAGAWVLLAGLARYAFAGAARLAPWMRRALPPSRRRRTACALAVAALIACITPLVPQPAAALAAAAGLAALAASFTADALWLAARARSAPPQEVLHDAR